jgi:hypothetical protein
MVRSLLLLSLLGSPVLVSAAEPASSASVDYAAHIKPILTERCVACHGALKQEGGLRLDTAKLAIRGGDSGAAIVPGDPSLSPLHQRVASQDPSLRMPQEGEPLTPTQIAHLKRWIELRSPAPADEQPEANPRDHWAFRPVVRPPTPTLSSAASAWIRNPIDAFIAAKLASQGLSPQVEAPRAVLIRRVYLDLVGVPPTPREWDALLADRNPQWYEQLVDRLLADPRYGERWARHWMDVWRYSDWWGLGDQLRNSQYHIWHWRDWIIESLNSDLGYDEMVRLMLAGDESHPNDLSRLRATGFLARNYFLFNRNQWLDETVEHVSKGLLGLTMNCAKCHDHKYDPIEHVDYYRMRAFFEPYHVRQDLMPGEVNLMKDGVPRPFDGLPDAPTYRFERGEESKPDKSKLIAPGVPAILAFTDLKVEPIPLPVDSWQPVRRPWVAKTYLADSQKQIDAAQSALKAAKEKLAAAQKASPKAPHAEHSKTSADAAADCRVAELALDFAKAEHQAVVLRVAAMKAAWAQMDAPVADLVLAAAERKGAMEAFLAERRAAVAKATWELAKVESRLAKAAADKKKEIEKEVAAARTALATATKSTADAKADAMYTPLVGAQWTPTRFYSSLTDDPKVPFPPQSTGRRTALARWITDSRNPLTARVAVNHVWNRRFGAPLAPTVFDFGRKGPEPLQRELLDWLAAEFMQTGWSMKRLHRMMLTSATYRLSSSSADSAANLAKDPDDRFGWRRTPIRIESQVVRDSILALSGKLDPTIGGPPVPPAEQASSTRRSLYFFHSNNERDRFLTTFDEASVKECYRRDQSIVPQQALALANSQLVHDSLAPIVDQLCKADPAPIDDSAFARRAFLVLLGVQATEAEVKACLTAMQQWKSTPSEAKTTAASETPRARLIWALINHNDFVTLR